MFRYLREASASNLSIILALAYLLIGLITVYDYGISYDEEVQRFNNGMYNYFFVTNQDKSLLLNGNEKYHGGAFELTLIFIEKAAALKDIRKIYLLRHLVNFLVFFASVLFMYLLAGGVFKERKWAIFAAMVYALSPRFFAESHYNSKDVICLAFMVISFYTLYRFSKHTNFKWAFIHAFVTGYMIDIRVVTIFMIGITAGFIIYDNWILNKEQKSQTKPGLVLIGYFVFQLAAIVAFWPVLWDDPVYHIKEAISEIAHLDNDTVYNYFSGDIKYWGAIYKHNTIPWHYIPGSMMVTIPFVYQILAFIAIIIGIVQFISFKREMHAQLKYNFLFLASFLSMLVVLIITKPGIYDSWRHVYFLYAPLVLVVTNGAVIFWNKLQNTFSIKRKKLVLTIGFLLVFAGPVISMIAHHPYQNVYFNWPARAIFGPMEKSFEMDYWGLSYKQGLTYILNTDTSAKIKLLPEHAPGFDNRLLLRKEDRIRLDYVSNYYQEGVYVLMNMRAKLQSEPEVPADLIHQVKSPSGVLLWIYKTLGTDYVKTNLYHIKDSFDGPDQSRAIGYAQESLNGFGKVDSANPYGTSYFYTVDSNFLKGKPFIDMKAKFLSKESYANVLYVVEVHRNGNLEHWGACDQNYIFTFPDEWYPRNWQYDLEKIKLEAGDTIKVYLWSTKGQEVWQDDLEIDFCTIQPSLAQ